MKEILFPADKGVAGHVYRTGKLIVPDTSSSPHFFPIVDTKSSFQTHNMLDVPIQIPERMIGVLMRIFRANMLQTGIIYIFEPPPQTSPAGRGSLWKVQIMLARSVYASWFQFFFHLFFKPDHP
jgi:hypothetical protein